MRIKYKRHAFKLGWKIFVYAIESFYLTDHSMCHINHMQLQTSLTSDTLELMAINQC